MEQDIVVLKQSTGQSNHKNYQTYGRHYKSEETEQYQDPETNRQFLYTLTAEQVITCTCIYILVCVCAYIYMKFLSWNIGTTFIEGDEFSTIHGGICP